MTTRKPSPPQSCCQPETARIDRPGRRRCTQIDPSTQVSGAISSPTTDHTSALVPWRSTGQDSSPTPTNPISSAPITFGEGTRRSRKASMIAPQMGITPTSSAARPEFACFSAQVTRPLPPTHISRPEPASTTASPRVGRRRWPRNAAQISRTAAAVNTRMQARVNGGKPAPSRTATRMAR